MTKMPICYEVLKSTPAPDTMTTDLYMVRAELEDIERRLIPLLVSVQRALGKEPSVQTRAERRRR